jgi:ABC-type branched-subunit amino acid transport system ATPase component
MVRRRRPVLEVVNLRSAYGRIEVLRRQSQRARRRGRGLIGSNGAGKTTLLRALSACSRSPGRNHVPGRAH